MIIKSLKNTSIETLCKVFNQAFENYFVPIELKKEQLEQKIINDRIDLERSVGAFVDNQLVAFLLHGVGTMKGKKAFYNAGTGVIPAHRSKGITGKMYAYILPKLKAANFESGVLEVITDNQAAIKSYERVGFSIEEELICFKGSINFIDPFPFDKVKQLSVEKINWDNFEKFWDWNPSWQYRSSMVQNDIKNLSTWAYIEDNKALGYVIFDQRNSKIIQFAVDKSRRREKIASTLFHFIAKQSKREISLINVKSSGSATISFLEKLGFKAFIKQYEMFLSV